MSNIVKVFHFDRKTNSFVHVANVAASDEAMEDGPVWAMEEAFRLTNNTDGSWSLKDKIAGFNVDASDAVEVVAPLHVDDRGKEWGLRSTSVGDEMEFGGKRYKVGIIGFDEIK